MSAETKRNEETALGLLRELNTYEDFDMALEVCGRCRNCCGYADPSGVNEVRARIGQFLRDVAMAEEFWADQATQSSEEVGK